MKEELDQNLSTPVSGQKVTVWENGPYLVTGSISLAELKITHDVAGYAIGWKEMRRYPQRDEYSLCRCGHSSTKPFCDGTHGKIHFDGTPTAGHELYREGVEEIDSPNLTLINKKTFCVHAPFCQRSGGIWNLTRQSDSDEARETAIEEAGNCPSGRLVVWNTETGDPIEPVFEPSIAIVENSLKGEHGPVWVRSRIPVECPDGSFLETRNRLTLCRCGRSCRKPFCDGSHLEPEYDAGPWGPTNVFIVVLPWNSRIKRSSSGNHQ